LNAGQRSAVVRFEENKQAKLGMTGKIARFDFGRTQLVPD